MTFAVEQAKQKLKEELLAGQAWLAKSNNAKAVRSAITAKFPGKQGYILLNHTPDQGEDHFTVLVDHTTIAKVCVSQLDQSVDPVEVIATREYRKRLGKAANRKLDGALDLVG